MNYNHLGIQTVPGAEWDRLSPRSLLQYAVGALLYAPANHPGVGDDICRSRYPQLKNIALCLEDAVLDDTLAEAELLLMRTVEKIYDAVCAGRLPAAQVPLLFVRVRSPEQMRSLFSKLGESAGILTGFVLPKFDTANMHAYCEVAAKLRAAAAAPLYILPIIESAAVMRAATRASELAGIRRTLDDMRDAVLNVRVGGNDFCNIFGLRRDRGHTIYDIAVVRDVLADIFNAFGADYVVSAPVWEYFGAPGDESWSRGLQAELALDRLNGFVGKTAVHPSQLEVIQRAFVVDRGDYEDARATLNWTNGTGVSKSAHSLRMNEVKSHQKWALRTMMLAEVYGVKE